MNKRKKYTHLRTMEKRKEFLLSKKGTPVFNSWMAAELGATQYAIDLIETEIANNADRKKVQYGVQHVLLEAGEGGTEEHAYPVDEALWYNSLESAERELGVQNTIERDRRLLDYDATFRFQIVTREVTYGREKVLEEGTDNNTGKDGGII